MKILLVNDTRGVQEYLYRSFEKMGFDCDIGLFSSSTAPAIDLSLNGVPIAYAIKYCGMGCLVKNKLRRMEMSNAS